ncbi:bacteriocin [Streptococcus halichoeri]|nr:bacteriocin [Streptococcus halichoeri]
MNDFKYFLTISETELDQIIGGKSLWQTINLIFNKTIKNAVIEEIAQ